MTDKKSVDLSEFNARAIIRYFDYLDMTTVEAQAIEFIYNRENSFNAADDKLDAEANDAFKFSLVAEGNGPARDKLVADKTLDKILFGYELYKLHAPSFFPQEYKANYNALSIAVICDEYTLFINEQLQEQKSPDGWDYPDNDNLRFRDDGFDDDDAVMDAEIIWNEASELESHGLCNDIDRPRLESFCLAHINRIKRLRAIEREFDGYSMDQLEDILKNDIQVTQDFIMPETSLGATAQKYTGQIEDRIIATINLTAHELPNRGLKVVSPVPPEAHI